jgi:hypothetical protein
MCTFLSNHTSNHRGRFLRVQLFLFCVAVAALQSGCKHDHSEDEHGNITTVRMSLVPSGGSSAITVNARDIDGPGGNPPQVDTLRLVAGSAFSASVELKDESVTPMQDRTQEIRNFSDTHFFRYTTSGNVQSRMQMSNFDLDTKGQPFGMRFQLQVSAGNAATGSLRVLLEHHDTGDKSSGMYETDIEVVFPVVITAAPNRPALTTGSSTELH